MTIKVKSNATGGSLQNENSTDALIIDGAASVSFPQGLTTANVIKQSKVKRNFFSAYLPTNFGFLTVGGWTLVRLYTEIIDSANTFDPTTNGRFQPNVAGWYQINANVTVGGDVKQTTLASLWKNGAVHRRIGGTGINTNNLVTNTFSGSFPVYLNGTTDYVDLRVYTDQPNANALGDANGEYTSLSGYLIEAD